MTNIPNIYHIFYDKINNNIFLEYEYYAIKSIIEVNNPSKIYFNYTVLPYGIFWDMISNKLILLNVKLLNDIKIKNILIFKSLIDYGGIYISINSICINPCSDLLNNKFIKSKNNEFICCEKNSNIAKEYLKYYMNNKLSNELSNKSNYDIIYDSSFKNIYTDIHDYSFGTYFNLVSNYKFIFLTDTICISDCLNKITIYNLLVRNAIGYRLINNLDVCCIEKYYLINNIDIIYWINLEKSIERRDNMIKLLNNFNNIPNERVNAIDGNLDINIKTKYFYKNDNTYPDYSNKEYATLLSHLNAIEMFSNLNNVRYGIALIFEDDLSLDFMKYWNDDINTITKNAPQDWDIIMLGYSSLKLFRDEKYQKWNNEWSAMAYLVNHNIKHKINNIKKDDKWICKETDLMVSDNYIFSKFNTYVYHKPYFTFPNNNDSILHPDHLNYHRIYKISNYITLETLEK